MPLVSILCWLLSLPTLSLPSCLCLCAALSIRLSICLFKRFAQQVESSRVEEVVSFSVPGNFIAIYAHSLSHSRLVLSDTRYLRCSGNKLASLASSRSRSWPSSLSRFRVACNTIKSAHSSITQRGNVEGSDAGSVGTSPLRQSGCST